MVEDDTAHAFSKKEREAMYAFFQKHLNNPGDSTDINVQSLPKEELQVTKTGQVSTSINGAETVFSLNLKDVKKDMYRLQKLRKSPNYLSKVLRSAKVLSGYRDPKAY